MNYSVTNNTSFGSVIPIIVTKQNNFVTDATIIKGVSSQARKMLAPYLKNCAYSDLNTDAQLVAKTLKAKDKELYYNIKNCKQAKPSDFFMYITCRDFHYFFTGVDKKIMQILGAKIDFARKDGLKELYEIARQKFAIRLCQLVRKNENRLLKEGRCGTNSNDYMRMVIDIDENNKIKSVHLQ